MFIKTFISKFGFIDIKPCKNGLYSGLSLPPKHSLFIWRLSWLSLVAGIYAISRGHYSLAPVPLGVYVTSLNYWRHPIHSSLRRKIDITYVCLSLLYQVWRSVNAQYHNMYILIMSITICFFPLGIWLNKYSSWLGTFCHGMCHVGGNIGNIILYSGSVSSLKENLEFLENILK